MIGILLETEPKAFVHRASTWARNFFSRSGLETPDFEYGLGKLGKFGPKVSSTIHQLVMDLSFARRTR